MNTYIIVGIGVMGLILAASALAGLGYGTTIQMHPLGEIASSTTLCRSNGDYCPGPGGSFSCVRVDGPQKDRTSTAACASGYKVTGGGCYTGGWIYNTQVSGNGWTCSAEDPYGNAARVIAYAVCCRIA